MRVQEICMQKKNHEITGDLWVSLSAISPAYALGIVANTRRSSVLLRLSKHRLRLANEPRLRRNRLRYKPASSTHLVQDSRT
jgi:hypothetical protein